MLDVICKQVINLNKFTVLLHFQVERLKEPDTVLNFS